jgi:hypothetical protein
MLTLMGRYLHSLLNIVMLGNSIDIDIVFDCKVVQVEVGVVADVASQ